MSSVDADRTIGVDKVEGEDELGVDKGTVGAGTVTGMLGVDAVLRIFIGGAELLVAWFLMSGSLSVLKSN